MQNLLYKNLKRGGSREGDLILDPFVGSGTTAVVAYRLKRNFIGFEISSQYVEIAQNRLKFEKMHQKLPL